MKGDYEEIYVLIAAKNKANLFVLSSEFCGKEVEKTKPICDGTERRKFLLERKIWQYSDLRDTKKQSQSKPIVLVQRSALIGKRRDVKL